MGRPSSRPEGPAIKDMGCHLHLGQPSRRPGDPAVQDMRYHVPFVFGVALYLPAGPAVEDTCGHLHLSDPPAALGAQLSGIWAVIRIWDSRRSSRKSSSRSSRKRSSTSATGGAADGARRRGGEGMERGRYPTAPTSNPKNGEILMITLPFSNFPGASSPVGPLVDSNGPTRDLCGGP